MALGLLLAFSEASLGMETTQLRERVRASECRRMFHLRGFLPPAYAPKPSLGSAPRGPPPFFASEMCNTKKPTAMARASIGLMATEITRGLPSFGPGEELVESSESDSSSIEVNGPVKRSLASHRSQLQQQHHAAAALQ